MNSSLNVKFFWVWLIASYYTETEERNLLYKDFYPIAAVTWWKDCCNTECKRIFFTDITWVNATNFITHFFTHTINGFFCKLCTNNICLCDWKALYFLLSKSLKIISIIATLRSNSNFFVVCFFCWDYWLKLGILLN